VIEPGTQHFAADETGPAFADDLVGEALSRRDVSPCLDPRRVAQTIALRVEPAQRAILPRRCIAVRNDEVDDR
jgi:hypothetical protein